MLMQKLERCFAVNAVLTLEVFDVELIGESELRVQPADFGKFVSDTAITTDPVMMPAFDHDPRSTMTRVRP